MVGGGSGVLVEDNEIAHNNTQGFDVGWEACGSKWWDTTDLTVRGNYSHDNAGLGLWTDFNNYRTVHEGNVVADNANGGIFHEISYDATTINRQPRHGQRLRRAALGIDVDASGPKN